MRCKMWVMGGRIAILAAVLVVSLCAQAQSAVRIQVSPSTGGRKTTFVVSFRSPSAARYTVDISGPANTRCDLAQIGPTHRFKKGAPVKIHLYPDIRGWCRGRYRVTVDEVAGSSPDDRFLVGRQVFFRVR